MNKTPKRTRFQPTRHWIWAAKIVLKEERAKRRDPKWLPKYLTGAQQVRALLKGNEGLSSGSVRYLDQGREDNRKAPGPTQTSPSPDS
jgi:hypothetical protein